MQNRIKDDRKRYTLPGGPAVKNTFPQSMGDIEFPRGEACPQITADRIDIWFIDGNIFIHQITKVAHSKFHHGKVPLYSIFAQKAALMDR